MKYTPMIEQYLKIKKEYAIENYEDIGKYAEKMFIMYKKVHN